MYVCATFQVANVVGWLFCLGTTCAVIYGMYTDGDSHVMSKWESVVFVAVFRTVWGVALCWVIFACATGHGGKTFSFLYSTVRRRTDCLMVTIIIVC